MESAYMPLGWEWPQHFYKLLLTLAARLRATNGLRPKAAEPHAHPGEGAGLRIAHATSHSHR
eukprot:777198-Alexandrium_andersonii.AAC.1